MNKLFSILLGLTISISAFSQVPVGQWTAHIPNQKGLSLCEAGDKIYCLTETGIFYYNTKDKSINQVDKISGLTNINTKSIYYHETTKTVYLGYEDGMIDIITNNNQITSFSDITRKNYSTKSINKIQEFNDLIYFSTNFGIVVFDPFKLEFTETYIIGNNGYEIRVNSLAFDDNFIYAATEYGVRKASTQSVQLGNYREWGKISYFPYSNREFSEIAIFKEKIVANLKQPWAYTYHTYVADPLTQSYYTLNPDSETYAMEIKVVDNRLWMIHKNHIGIYDNLSSPAEFYNQTNFSWGHIGINANDAILTKDNSLWYADDSFGLVRSNYNDKTGSYKKPNGPKNNNAFYLSSGNETTWLAAGALFSNGANTWTAAGLSRLSDGFWQSYDNANIPIFKSVYDVIAIEQDPNNPNKIFICTGNSGVIEMDFANKNKPSYVLHNDTTTGSVLKPLSDHLVKVIECHLDEYMNLWTISPRVRNPIAMKSPSGDWVDFPWGNQDLDYGKFIITSSGTKWFIVQRGNGLFIFDEAGTIDDFDDDLQVHIGVSDENGEIISNDLFAITEDKNDDIWLGTQNGVVVFYDPEKAHNTNQEGLFASKIIIDINGKNEHLMEGKKVTAIAVDGANRKWIGTEQSGIFLMSEDGTKQILTFNKDNSPLPSDNIKSISIDANSGEIFIATALGLMSYRGEATEGNERFKDVYAFPNPVKPGYEGPITIKGLMENSTVKITDISGNLVNEMTSLGGQAIWDGKTLNGNRAKTGVYLVFLSAKGNDIESVETAITKILFIN